MKKNIGKHILSLALALLMVVGIVPVNAQAADRPSFVVTSPNLTWTSNTPNPEPELQNVSCGKGYIGFDLIKSGEQVDSSYNKPISMNDFDCTTGWTNHQVQVTGTYQDHEFTLTAMISREPTDHTGGMATCTTKAVCTVCKQEYGEPDPNAHDYSWYREGERDGVRKHWQVCSYDETHTTAKEACSAGANGREPTCDTLGKCGTCDGNYGPLKPHSFSYTVNEINNTIDQDCTECILFASAHVTANSLTYNGQPQTGLTIGTVNRWTGDLPVVSATATNAGTHTGTMTYTKADGTTLSVSEEFTITPASLDDATVNLENYSIEYDGQNHKPRYSVELDGFGELMKGRDYEAVYLAAMKMDNGVPTKWFGNHTSTTDAACINAGTYGVIIRGVDGGNFAVSEGNEMGVFAAFTIDKADPKAEMFYVDLPQNMVFDGTIHAADVTVKDDIVGMGEVTVKYNGGPAPTDAGTFIVTVDVAEGDNYSAVSNLELGRFTVARINGTGVIHAADWTYGEPAVSPVPVSSTNGTEHVTYWYKVKGADDSTFTATVPTQAGDYTIKAVFAATTNYNEAEHRDDFTIHKAVPAIGTVTAEEVENTLELSAVSLSWANTDVAGTLAVDADQTLVLGENEIAYTFTPDDTDNYKTVTGTVNVSVVDTVAPTGTVTVSTKSWAEFLNNITFGLFFNKTQTVAVAAADNFSGVDKIEYIESKTKMDLDAVKAAEQWREMKNGSVSVTLEDAKQFVYYIRLTDKAGNVTYLSSDGAEYDTTAPVIEGVEDGKTYYTTQVVTVTDKNIDTITLNGEAATGSITLEGNKEATYTIVATDKAGSVTTVVVTMKPIRDLAEATENLSHDNVTSADAPALEELVEKLEELLADEDVSEDGEQETLEQHKHIAESLLKTIEDAAKAADTENTAKVEDVTAENVKPEDEADLNKAKTDLEKALADNKGNYTEAEKKSLEEEIQRIEDALEAIENAEAVEKVISELPETAKPEDEEAVEKVDAAKKAYEQLTKHEKSLIGKDAVEKLAKLIAAATDYEITAGNDSKWTEDTDGALSFTANGSFNKFVGIAVNGKEVAKENYEAKAGSTVITLKPSYLNTLKPGEYEFAVVYTDGAAEGTFTVEAKVNPAVPGTGDEADLLLWSSLMMLAACGMLMILKKKTAAK